MKVSLRFVTAVVLSLLMMNNQSGAVRADQTEEKKPGETSEKPSVADFPENLIRIEAPAGWSISDSGTQRDHAWCVLQKDDSKIPRPTIVILCGRDFITQAPGGSNFLAGAPAAAMLHATGRTLAWAREQSEPPYPRVGGQSTSAVTRYGKTQYLAQKMEFGDAEFRNGATYAVMAGKRAGGPLVAACFDEKNELKKTQALLESILSATYVRERRTRKPSSP